MGYRAAYAAKKRRYGLFIQEVWTFTINQSNVGYSSLKDNI
jgi:hypothetical protein